MRQFIIKRKTDGDDHSAVFWLALQLYLWSQVYKIYLATLPIRPGSARAYCVAYNSAKRLKTDNKIRNKELKQGLALNHLIHSHSHKKILILVYAACLNLIQGHWWSIGGGGV